MTQPSDSNPNVSGRYRFQRDRPLDPDAGVHPEMAGDQPAASQGVGIPSSPQELIAMQDNKPDRHEKRVESSSPKVKQVLELIETLDTNAYEDQQIALALVRHLEQFHDSVVDEMKDDNEAKHSQIACWAVDADRLMRCRILLESVDLD